MICSCGGQMKPTSTVIDDVKKAQKLLGDIQIDYRHMPIRESLHNCKPCGRVLYEILGQTGILYPAPANNALQSGIFSSSERPVKRNKNAKAAERIALANQAKNKESKQLSLI